MEYRLLGEGVMAHRRSFEKLNEVEAIVFDCDGTIIDSTESYYLADRMAASIILSLLYGLDCSFGKDVNDLLARLEMLGGFNNDWYKTSLLVQATALKAADPPVKIADDLPRVSDVDEYLRRCLADRSAPEYVEAGLRWLSQEASKNYGRFLSLRDLEVVVDAEAERAGRLENLRSIRAALGPLDGYGSGLLATLYDELFLGEEGVKERYGASPRYVSWEGLLDRERPIIREEVLEELLEDVPKGLAIATGRGAWETRRALEGLLEYFNLEASVFSADLPGRFEKPNPEILIECSRRLGAERIMYVGNSLEDLLLVENARRKGLDAVFTGVLTNPYSLEIFVRRGADAIIEDVNLLPRLLEQEESFWKPF